MTSSRFWSITGKRECAVAITCLTKVSTGSLMSMKSTWARGIMMSRTCISETVSAPSMIESASASSRLREYAARSSWVSSDRSPGSRMISADRRSSRLGRDGSFMPGAFISFYRWRVGIADSAAAQDADLARFHARRIPFLFMIVAAQVQAAVHHEMRVVRGERLFLRARLAPHHRMAQHDVAGREGEHVRRAVLLAEYPVEPATLGFTHDAQGHRRHRPAAQERRARHAAARDCVLDLDPILPAGARRRHR